MTDKRKYKYTIVFIILGIGVLVLLGCNIRIGSVSFSVQEVLQALLHKEVLDSATTIIWNIRFPRALAVLILGGALGLSGYLLQTFFHNPIAGPFVLGISSGAKMLVALVMIGFLKRGITVSSSTMIVSAFFGSMISMGFVLAMSKKYKECLCLLLAVL